VNYKLKNLVFAGYFKALLQYLPGATKNNHGKGRMPPSGPFSNSGPPKQEAIVLIITPRLSLKGYH
jgi:hypothetical protein